MFFGDEVLSYQHHHDQIRLNLIGILENDAYFLFQAAEMHALSVADAVSDLRVRSVIAGEGRQGEVRSHLVYGVSRRTGDIWSALRELVLLTPPNRTTPLSLEDTAVTSRGLNGIYINIRGTLDNLAWAAIEAAGGLAAVGLNHTSVDLFGRRFWAVEAFAELVAPLTPFKPWSEELKARRNPAAHRIPLAMISAEMDDGQTTEFRRLTAEMLAPLPPGPVSLEQMEVRMARHQAIKSEIARLGVFRPLFAHMPSEGAMPVYPTVPQDVGQMVRVADVVLGYLAQTVADQGVG